MSNEKNDHHRPEPDPRKPGRTEPEIRYVPMDIRGMESMEEDEIDLVELLKTIWDGRKTIYITVAMFIVLGLLVALSSGVEYTSEVRMLSEHQDQGQVGMRGLAQQFGMNISSQGSYGALPPQLYPDVTQSVLFIQELLAYEVTLPENPGETVSLEDYFNEHYTPPSLSYLTNYTIYLPFTVLRRIRSFVGSFFSGEEKQGLTTIDRTLWSGEKAGRIIRMTPERWGLIRNLRGRISASWDTGGSTVTVSVKMPDPVMAADVADQVVQLLTEYITEYRTEKMRRDLAFIEERYEEAENRFEEAQKALAAFNDQNRGQLTAMARTEEQLLQSRYDLTFGLYNSLAQQLEQARLKLQKETPVMNILEPAAVPDRRSEPNRKLKIIVFTFLGTVLGIGITLIMPVINKIKNELT